MNSPRSCICFVLIPRKNRRKAVSSIEWFFEHMQTFLLMLRIDVVHSFDILRINALHDNEISA
jgi:hypothetical protein